MSSEATHFLPSTLEILLLEDSPYDADLIEAELDKLGLRYLLTRVDTELDFCKEVAARKYHVILVDYTLPDFDGLSALMICRKEIPETPFIFVSGTLGEERAIEALNRGASDYVLKQNLPRLNPAIKRALRENEERKQIKLTQEALQKSQELSKQILGGVKEYAIFMLDNDGKFVTWNTGAANIFGYEEKEIIGKDYSLLFTQEDRDKNLPSLHLEKARTEGRCEEEHANVRKNGEPFFANGVLSPLYNAKGQIHGYTKVLRDISDRIKQEQERERMLKELEQAKEEAERANNAKDQFLSMLSHELRTPLTPILATVEALQMESFLPEYAQSFLDIIHRNVQLEAKLIDDLLDLTRIAKGKLRLSLEVVSLHQIISNAIEVIQSQMQEKRLELRLALHAEEPFVLGDSTRLEQVLLNLLANAIKFTPTNGTVTIRTENEQGFICTKVSDTGIGVEPDLLPKLFNAFESFEQGSATRRATGLGLGLAISRNLAIMHNGTLHAESEGKGKGASFTLMLPIASKGSHHQTMLNAPSRAEALVHTAFFTEPSRTDKEQEKNSSNSTIQVLLVEDHLDTNQMLRNVLLRRGFDVHTANTFQLAIELGRSKRFDLLISDIGLPDGSGWDILQTLASHAPNAAIAMSGFGTDTDIERSYQAGFQEHLIKPFKLNQLFSAIERALSKERVTK